MSEPGVKQEHTKNFQLSRVCAGSCALLLVGFLLFIMQFFLLFAGPSNNVTAYEGDTVHLVDVADILPVHVLVRESLVFKSQVSHYSDIYVVPTSFINEFYLKYAQKTVQGDEAIQVNASKKRGQVLFLYHLQSIVYYVIASSDNKTGTASNGELFIFNSYLDYNNYVTLGLLPDKDDNFFHEQFAIGSNNDNISQVIRFTPKSVNPNPYFAYHFVTCSTPARVALSFRATVNVSYYDYKEFSQKRCTVKHLPNNNMNCSIDISPSDKMSVFAHVNPNPEGPPSATNLQFTVQRLLPSPSQHVYFMIAMVVCITVVVLCTCHIWIHKEM